MKVTAKRQESKGQKGWVINGVKTWCTFAGCGDTPDGSSAAPTPISQRNTGACRSSSPRNRRFEATNSNTTNPITAAISKERPFPLSVIAASHSLRGGLRELLGARREFDRRRRGAGQGLLPPDGGFAGGRLQTAARALGVMQAAFESALRYSNERSFNKPIFDYGITQWKLVRMAALIQAARQASYHASRLMDEHKGQMEASLVKFYASKISEWVTEKALQIHGGYGYAEEYAVSRYFVDAPRLLDLRRGRRGARPSSHCTGVVETVSVGATHASPYDPDVIVEGSPMWLPSTSRLWAVTQGPPLHSGWNSMTLKIPYPKFEEIAPKQALRISPRRKKPAIWSRP